jgi:hypothetical protein
MGAFGAASLAMQAASMVAGQQQASKAAKAQAAQVEAQNAYMQQQQDIKAKQQRDLLGQQLAATRARLAAGGIGVGSGSGQALMAGMVRDSEEQLADQQALLDTRASNALSGQGSSGDGLTQGLALARQGLNLFGQFKGGRD